MKPIHMEEKLKLMEEKYPLNSIIEGKVYMLAPFGIFLKIGHSEYMGLIEVINILDDSKNFNYNLYPSLNSKVSAKVIGYRPENNQIYLSMKPSDLYERNK